MTFGRQEGDMSSVHNRAGDMFRLAILNLLLNVGLRPTRIQSQHPPWCWMLYDIAVLFEDRYLTT